MITGEDDPYKRCLDRYEDLSEISKKYSCDILNSTYDQYEFREKCWTLECVDDDSVGDIAGDTCSAWYYDNSNGCGNYDTDEFNSLEMCCACGGGFKGDPYFELNDEYCTETV